MHSQLSVQTSDLASLLCRAAQTGSRASLHRCRHSHASLGRPEGRGVRRRRIQHGPPPRACPPQRNPALGKAEGAGFSIRNQRTNAMDGSTPELGDTAPIEPGAGRRKRRREGGLGRRRISPPAESRTFPKLSLLNSAPDSGPGMLNPAPLFGLSMLNPAPIPIKTIKSFSSIGPAPASESCPQGDAPRRGPAPVRPEGKPMPPAPGCHTQRRHRRRKGAREGRVDDPTLVETGKEQGGGKWQTPSPEVPESARGAGQEKWRETGIRGRSMLNPTPFGWMDRLAGCVRAESSTLRTPDRRGGRRRRVLNPTPSGSTRRASERWYAESSTERARENR